MIKESKKRNTCLRISEQIKPGYKKTPAGIIPEDWEVKKLGQIISKAFSGTTPDRNNTEYYKGGMILWIKSGELINWNITETDEKITEKAFKETSLRKVKPNTIVYALYGATAGVVSETKIEATLNQAILAIYLKESYYKGFIKYYLHYNKNKFINKYTQRGQQNLISKTVKNYNIILPPTHEQKSITNCLSTWDSGIEKLTQLIQAKKLRKKGLMQQIFNGQLAINNEQLSKNKVRVKKINNEGDRLKGWKEVKLGEIGETFNGLTGKTKEDFGKGKSYVSYLNVFNNNS